jgi:hypothetical protein
MDEAPDRVFEKQKWRAVDNDEEYCPAGDAEEGEDEDEDEDEGANEEKNDKAIGDEEESLVAEEEEENEDQLYQDVWVKK